MSGNSQLIIFFISQNIIVTGGLIDGKVSALTEMSVNFGRWDIVSSASLPFPLIDSAALTINNQVYLFGNFSREVQPKITQ